MVRFFLSRIVYAVPTLLAMLTAIFVLARLVPGDAATVILGDHASGEALNAMREKLGLNRTIAEQYIDFVWGAFTGDFGRSLISGRTVLAEVIVVLPYTIELTVAAILFGVVFGLPAGIGAAVMRNRLPDYISRILSLAGISFPSFVLGILLLLAFAVQLRWLPVLNTTTTGSLGERLWNLILPTINLGLIMVAYVIRVTRASMLNVLQEDYIRTGRAKGAAPVRLIMRHALPNALIPVVTVIGLYFGTLIGNSVLTEIVFNRPGLGKLILGALNARDYTLLQGLMVIFAMCVIFVNTATDLVYGLVDPRVRDRR